jgi:hypothetical protein
MTIKVPDVAARVNPADLPKKILREGNLTISAIAGHHRDNRGRCILEMQFPLGCR